MTGSNSDGGTNSAGESHEVDAPDVEPDSAPVTEYGQDTQVGGTEDQVHDCDGTRNEANGEQKADEVAPNYISRLMIITELPRIDSDIIKFNAYHFGGDFDDLHSTKPQTIEVDRSSKEARSAIENLCNSHSLSPFGKYLILLSVEAKHIGDSVQVHNVGNIYCLGSLFEVSSDMFNGNLICLSGRFVSGPRQIFEGVTSAQFKISDDIVPLAGIEMDVHVDNWKYEYQKITQLSSNASRDQPSKITNIKGRAYSLNYIEDNSQARIYIDSRSPDDTFSDDEIVEGKYSGKNLNWFFLEKENDHFFSGILVRDEINLVNGKSHSEIGIEQFWKKTLSAPVRKMAGTLNVCGVEYYWFSDYLFDTARVLGESEGTSNFEELIEGDLAIDTYANSEIMEEDIIATLNSDTLSESESDSSVNNEPSASITRETEEFEEVNETLNPTSSIEIASDNSAEERVDISSHGNSIESELDVVLGDEESTAIDGELAIRTAVTDETPNQQGTDVEFKPASKSNLYIGIEIGVHRSKICWHYGVSNLLKSNISFSLFNNEKNYLRNVSDERFKVVGVKSGDSNWHKNPGSSKLEGQVKKIVSQLRDNLPDEVKACIDAADSGNRVFCTITTSPNFNIPEELLLRSVKSCKITSNLYRISFQKAVISRAKSSWKWTKLFRQIQFVVIHFGSRKLATNQFTCSLKSNDPSGISLGLDSWHRSQSISINDQDTPIDYGEGEFMDLITEKFKESRHAVGLNNEECRTAVEISFSKFHDEKPPVDSMVDIIRDHVSDWYIKEFSRSKDYLIPKEWRGSPRLIFVGSEFLSHSRLKDEIIEHMKFKEDNIPTSDPVQIESDFTSEAVKGCAVYSELIYQQNEYRSLVRWIKRLSNSGLSIILFEICRRLIF